MKTLETLVTLLAFIVSSGFNIANGQRIQSGRIIYEEKVKLEIELEGDAAEFASMLPTERTSQKVLYFNDEEVLYENVDNAETSSDHEMEANGMMLQVQVVEPDNKTYTNLKNNKQIEQREFMTRMFLIEKELTVLDWRITENQKKILDFQCMEAVYETNEGDKITAWFTPEIPIPGGPDTLLNLPGMVLAADFNDGKKTIAALSVNSEPVDKKVLAKPKKGKKVSDKEFHKIVEEKMKEMGMEQNEGGVVHQAIIRMER